MSSTTAEHLRHLTGAAVVALLRLLERTSTDGVDRAIERHPFLLPYVEEIARSVDDGDDWDTTFDRFVRQANDFEGSHDDLPLLRLDVPGDVHGRLVYAFAGLVADDLRFGAIAQMLQVPFEQPAFAPQTIATALDSPGERRTYHVVDRLLEQHLLWALDDEPLAGVRVDPSVWNLVRDGSHPWWNDDHANTTALDHWHDDRLRRLVEAVRGLVDGRVDTLVVRSVPGAGANEALAAAGVANGVTTVPVEARSLAERSDAAAAAIRGAIPIVEIDARPGSEVPAPRPRWYRGPLIVVMGRSGGLRPNGDRRLHVALDRSDRSERASFWRAARPRPTAQPDTLAAAFVLPDGYLRRIERDAATRADVDGRSRPRLDDLRVAARSIGEHALETRASPVPTDGLGWDDLVVPAAVAAALRSLERRCELREEIARGQRARGAAGVRALLLGPSGVGKTLAATVLASQLGRRAYRVDLAAIFDKYVGETEKHIDEILAATEQLDCVLVIDEGDTLLGARTDGSTANDRYANLETNFLLQRLEEYTGIVVVTSNAGDRIDPAFARRMENTVTFPRPRSAERVAIWRLHLPPDHGVTEMELHRLASEHRLTGGQIRNAAMHARMLSLDAGDRLDARHLEEAVTVEYRKSGRLLPGERRAVADGARRRDEFLVAQRAAAEDRHPAGRRRG